MLVHIADTIQRINESEKLGIDANVTSVRWTDILNRIYDRIDPIAEGGETYRKSLPNVDVYKGHATFVGPNTIKVNGDVLFGDHIVIATGARPRIPEIVGLENINYQTSDSIMRMENIPQRLSILGGGYIATEMAHIFSSLGSDVTLIVRGRRLLLAEDHDLSHRFTEAFKERVTVHLNTTIQGISMKGRSDLEIQCRSSNEDFTLESDELLIATGRVPTSDELNLEAAQIETENGYIRTDKWMRTNIESVFALGDVTNPHQLKHTANAETRVVSHNLIQPEAMIQIDLDPIPHAVFTNPQIAAVGATEQALRESGEDYITALADYSEVAYGWAMEDTSGFCKVIVDPNSSLLLGAHILGPQASTLIHQLIQGMRFNRTVHELARGMLYVHPALNEVVENALIKASAACMKFE